MEQAYVKMMISISLNINAKDQVQHVLHGLGVDPRAAIMAYLKLSEAYS